MILPLLLAALGLHARAACVTKLPSGGYDEPMTYEGLRACQAMERNVLVDEMFGKKVGKAQAGALKTLDARHRREEADFTVRHPELARLPLVAREEPAATKTAAAPRAAPPQDHEDLREKMLDASDNGRRGVTPEMAAALRASIMAKQGYVSPDMEDLLQSTSRDGVNLRTSTMIKLQKAAQQAHGAGLDLKTDKATEKTLLEEDLSGNPEHPGSGGQTGL
jgi:hypothetical protein